MLLLIILYKRERVFTVWNYCFWRSRTIQALLYFFFFSSRRRHTRLQGDWSSDVCSSDLPALPPPVLPVPPMAAMAARSVVASLVASAFFRYTTWMLPVDALLPGAGAWRSEERRVGKECRSRWSPYH